MLAPGTVVKISFAGAVRKKVRPSVVVCSNLYLANRPDLIISLLTTDVAAATEPTDYVLQDWAAAGLHHPTAFRAFIISRPKSDVLEEIGQLSDRDWQEVQARLRLALAVS
jgi:mRNA interferase MazF